MKRFFVVLSIILSANMAFSPSSFAGKTAAKIEMAGEISAYTITVYMIKNSGSVVISTKKSASYDSDNNTITVDGNTYRIQENSQYGKEGKKGAYRYVAGGIYYFNL